MPAINPDILIWARETSGLTIEQAAKKLQFNDSSNSTAVEKLLAYEAQEKESSRSLLLKMVKAYRKPLLSFYLQNRPHNVDRGEDFRTLPAQYEPVDDALVNVLIRDVRAKQSLIKDLLIDEDEAQNLTFIGSTNQKKGVNAIAQAIIQTLNFDLVYFRHFRRTEDGFKYLRNKTEELGIFVNLAGNLGSYHSNIDASIFRGYVLADEIAPFVIINDQDAKAAWAFTLLHELVHLWLGQTGVSGTYGDNQIEKFCDEVTSEVLLPHTEFSKFIPGVNNFSVLAEEISNYADERNLSSTLIAYRLLNRGVINNQLWLKLKNHYRELWLQYKQSLKDKNKDKDIIINPYLIRKGKLGDALLKFTKRMTDSGALTATKAGLLLGVRPVNVKKQLDTGRTV